MSGVVLQRWVRGGKDREHEAYPSVSGSCQWSTFVDRAADTWG